MRSNELETVGRGSAVFVRVRGHWYPGRIIETTTNFHDGRPIFAIEYTFGDNDRRTTVVDEVLKRVTLPC